MGLREFIIRRIMNSLILVFGAITFNFFIFRMMPGDPTTLLIPIYMDNPGMIDALRRLWGLDQPLHIQHVLYLRELPHADAVRLPVSSTRLDPPEGVTEVSVSAGVNSLRTVGTNPSFSTRAYKPRVIHRQAKALGFLLNLS